MSNLGVDIGEALPLPRTPIEAPFIYRWSMAYNKKACAKYRATHKKEMAAYREIHKERLSIWHRQYYKLHHAELLLKQRARYLKDKPSILAKQHVYSKKRQITHHDHLVRLRRKIRYGISDNQYLQMIQAANNKCQICGELFDRNRGNMYKPHIDHNHSTGDVRGLLCGNCNRGLGSFIDNISLLQSAINYLTKIKGERK